GRQRRPKVAVRHRSRGVPGQRDVAHQDRRDGGHDEDPLSSLWRHTPTRVQVWAQCGDRPNAKKLRRFYASRTTCRADAHILHPPTTLAPGSPLAPHLQCREGMTTHRRLLIIAFSCLGGSLASASFGQPAPGKAAALPSKATYQVDAKKSRFIVETETTGLSAMFAHDHKIGVRDFTGQATFMRDNAKGVSLTLTVQASSLYLLGENNIGERQSIESALREDVLETAKYPQIVFTSRNVTSERRGD